MSNVQTVQKCLDSRVEPKLLVSDASQVIRVVVLRYTNGQFGYFRAAQCVPIDMQENRSDLASKKMVPLT